MPAVKCGQMHPLAVVLAPRTPALSVDTTFIPLIRNFLNTLVGTGPPA